MLFERNLESNLSDHENSQLENSDESNDDIMSECESQIMVENEDNVVIEKTNEKKKESFDEMIKKIEKLKISVKETDKEINELEKNIKSKEKIRNDYEKQINNIFKLLNKAHYDEVNKARKEKKKRKGNINGGFNKESLVPEILANFLNIPSETYMSRPKVMSALNNKFNELKLKNGQNTILNEAVVNELKLPKEYEGQIIKFTEFQAFLASFYPKKQE
jgi:predicted RNase H-like nuclease (RuvC/YqgF family)